MTKSTSESNVKEKSGAINWFEEEHEFILDEVFATQDFCSFKGVYLNKPCQKNIPQSSEAEVATNFGIAATPTYVERFIGCVFDQSILTMFDQFKKLTD